MSVLLAFAVGAILGVTATILLDAWGAMDALTDPTQAPVWDEAIERAAQRVENIGQEHFYCTQHERHEGDGGANPPPEGKCWQNQSLVADSVRSLKEGKP